MLKQADLFDLLPWAKELHIFGGLTEDEILAILQVGFKQVGSPGDVLTRRTEQADSCYLILHGRVEIRNRAHVPIAILEAGELVGEMGMFHSRGERIADAVITRKATLLQLHYGQLRMLFDRVPDLESRFVGRLRKLADSRGETGSRASSFEALPRETIIPTPLVPIQIKMSLARCPIFGGFDTHELGQIVDLGRAVRLEANEYLFKEDDPADCLYVIALGRLAVIRPGGTSDQILANVGAGHCVGELPLVFKLATRSSSVITLTPSTLVAISYEALLVLGRARPELDAKLQHNLAKLVEERVHAGNPET